MNLSKKPVNAWDAAVLMVEAYFTSALKADQILELLPDDFSGQRRASCQSLFLGALRHGHRSRAACQPLLRKVPRPLVEAILLVAGFEFFSEPPERQPKIVHHAVERSKGLVNRFEQGFLNAVLRKLPAAIAAIDLDSAPADFYSHPDWLLAHWLEQFGAEDSRALLQWNQQIPHQTIRFYEHPEQVPDCLHPTEWPDFYSIARSADWALMVAPWLNRGKAYIKDPSTRLAPALLAPEPGMDVLDLCAAPGGKSYDLAHLMQKTGRIVALDLPGTRIARLQENLSQLAGPELELHVLAADLLAIDAKTFEAQGLPPLYDAIMLDAPCSNTGVIQRRTDVKWRLRPEDIQQCAQRQLKLLRAASCRLKPGGRIVYSTCSIEAAENREVVDHFLQSGPGQAFREVASLQSLPWQSGHDGAGAFLLERLS